MEKISSWTAPEGGGAPLLTMPNVPHPLHGLAPRTIIGTTEWNKMRKACYEEHEDTCEICGQKLSGSRKSDLPLHNAHEVYDYDYETYTATFVRPVCICPRCHNFIHSGRAITCYQNHTPLWTKEAMLDLAEHGFKLISEWNKQHPDDEPLKVFEAVESWLEEPSLEGELKALVKQYGIDFYYVPRTDRKSDWKRWKLVYDGVEYYSPYKNQREWQRAMDKNNQQNTEKNKNLFEPTEMNELAKAAEELGIF